MSTHILLVLANPTLGNEHEFNDWYTNRHLDEVLAIPGFVAARRFELTDQQLPGFPAGSHRFLALYEIEGDLDAALDALHERVESGAMVLSTSMDRKSAAPWAFTPITDRITRE